MSQYPNTTSQKHSSMEAARRIWSQLWQCQTWFGRISFQFSHIRVQSQPQQRPTMHSATSRECSNFWMTCHTQSDCQHRLARFLARAPMSHQQQTKPEAPLARSSSTCGVSSQAPPPCQQLHASLLGFHSRPAHRPASTSASRVSSTSGRAAQRRPHCRHILACNGGPSTPSQLSRPSQAPQLQEHVVIQDKSESAASRRQRIQYVHSLPDYRRVHAQVCQNHDHHALTSFELKKPGWKLHRSWLSIAISIQGQSLSSMPWEINVAGQVKHKD